LKSSHVLWPLKVLVGLLIDVITSRSHVISLIDLGTDVFSRRHIQQLMLQETCWE
jgi:hypothetical protein